MIRSFLFSTLVFCTSIVGAQTTLPTSWDFATTPSTLPTGWSTNTTASYSSGLADNSGGTSRAGKLQATGHYFTVHFFDEPGVVSYHFRAYSSNGANFTGTFHVQESEDGSTWNNLETYTDNAFGNNWTNFSTTPDVDSRYIRFFFTNKISGVNVGLDDVSIAASIPTEQEINLTYGGSDLPSGNSIQFASSVSTPLTLKFGVENIGTVDTLLLNGVSFSGSAASDYSVNVQPSQVLPASSDTLEITFTPSATGSRVAQMSIASNDANENPYLVDLDGIGGNAASEPTLAPTDLVLPTLKTYRVKGTYSAGDGESYLVVFKRNGMIDFTPQDGMSYERGQGVGNAKVANVGSDLHFWLKEATADDTFHVRVYTFNGSGAFTNYLEGEPLDTHIITPRRSTQFLNYYDNVDVQNSDFVEDLHTAIFPHTVRYYSNYGPDFVRGFIERDTTESRRVVTGVYSGDQVVYAPPFDWSSNSMSREHTLPYSWMPSNGSTNTPEYQDYHHLFPSVQSANSQRGNDPLGDVVNVSSSYGAGKRGTDAYGNTVYEPRDEQKGDAARALFYMMTTYDDPTGDRWGLDHLLSNGPNQRLDVLLEWHIADLPNGYEMARNDFLDSLQENRNPFVDSAHWACYINFRDMTYIDEPDSACLIGTQPSPNPVDTDTTIGVGSIDVRALEYLFYPNPTNDQLYLGHEDGRVFDVTIMDMMGRAVFRSKSHRKGWIDVSDLSSGMYVVNLSSSERHFAFRLVKE